MKPINVVALALLTLGLSGCGNKGPLVLPTAPPQDTAPEGSPPSAPPTPETLNDATRSTPPQGDGSEAGGTSAPPTPPPTPPSTPRG